MWVNQMSMGMPTRPSLRATEARGRACARCGGPFGDTPLEGVQFERRQEAAVATCAICLARVDVDRVVVRAGRWICDDCEAEGEER